MKESPQKYTNALIHETSPYLLQHAHNPVNWHAWNEEVLEKAKSENKLILISVGYSACHWCHVMEHECFEDENVAKLMNDYFICCGVIAQGMAQRWRHQTRIAGFGQHMIQTGQHRLIAKRLRPDLVTCC